MISISDSNTQAGFVATPMYHPSESGKTEFLGLEVVHDREDAADSTLVWHGDITIVNLTLRTSQWREIHRWIAWADQDGKLQILFKDITDLNIKVMTIDQFFEMDVVDLGMNDPNPYLKADLQLVKCDDLHSIKEYLARSGLELLL